MALPGVILLLLMGGAALTALLAFAFYRDPAVGMAQAGHLPEKLPLVMIDRYVGLVVLQIGLFLYGSLEMVAVFCVAAGVMACGDALIYRGSATRVAKHLAVVAFAAVALVVTLYFIFSSGQAT